jgi:hypothetical protein
MSTLALLRQTESEHGEEWENLAFPWRRCYEDTWEDYSEGLDIEGGSGRGFDDSFCQALRQRNYLTIWPVETLLTPQVRVFLRALCQTLRDTLPLEVRLKYPTGRVSRVIFEFTQKAYFEGGWVVVCFASPSLSGVDAPSWGYRLWKAIRCDDTAVLLQFCIEFLAYLEEVCHVWGSPAEAYFPVDVEMFYALWMLNTLTDPGGE